MLSVSELNEQAKSFCWELYEAGFEVEVCRGFSMDISTLFIAKKVK